MNFIKLFICFQLVLLNTLLSSTWQSYWDSQKTATSTDQISYLYAYDKSISDLSGIEQLTNLQHAYLSGNNFGNTDLAYLSQIESLTFLDISDGGKITNLNDIKNLTNLYYLNASGHKTTTLDAYLQMPNLRYLDISENYIDLSDSTVQSNLKTLREKGVFVEIGPQVPISVQDLSGIVTKRLSAINSNPDDPKENFIYGFELLLSLLEEDDSNSLKKVAINGGAASTLIDFTLPDLWRNDLDYDDNSELNNVADLNQMETYMTSTFIPKLTTINSHLLKMANYDGTIILTQDLTGKEDTIEVDAGDAFVIMAFTEALKAFVATISSYEWDYNLKDLETLKDDDMVSLETLLAPSDRFMKFGRLKASNQLLEAKSSFKKAIEYYKSGVDKMKLRLGQERLLEMNTSDLNDEKELRADLEEFLLALDNNHNLDDSTNQDIISLNSFFAGKFDPGMQLPEAVGEKFVTSEVTDPTFGGLFPNWTQSIVTQYANDEDLVTNDAIAGAVEVKGAPNWKKAGWLGYFYAPNRQQGSNEFLMFHGLLGWSYLKADSPSNIWIYHFDSKEWFWTKTSEFPNIYRSNDRNWYYIYAYKQFYIWSNNSWNSVNL
ncbi:MAG: hypothetical protein HN548_05375 [Opitutae bacterium]|nr:hypothetical protein [Opitutae bacterium]